MRKPTVISGWGIRASFLLLCYIIFCPGMQAMASPRNVYQQAVQVAAQGHDGEATAMLKGAADVLHGHDVWQQRMVAAAALLDMRTRQAMKPPLTFNPAPNSIHAGLMNQYIHDHPAPEQARVWIPGLLATLFPGSGHAWLTRWHDAVIAAMLVWPMLLLTFWAWKRRMGPVTVFFGLLTLWLWSGTVFSAVSLAERGSIEAYMQWWQGLWQFTGLPGRPW